MIVRQKMIFFGRVQGVGFRFRARQFAQSIGLTGSVRNLSDGSVELIAEGEKNKISELVDQLCHTSFIKVVEIKTTDIPKIGDLEFIILDEYL